MLTEQEYQKNLLRMFDSIRSAHKGAKGCIGVKCSDCPFNGKVCNTGKLYFRIYKAINIVEEWVKRHPIETGTDKLREDDK